MRNLGRCWWIQDTVKNLLATACHDIIRRAVGWVVDQRLRRAITVRFAYPIANGCLVREIIGAILSGFTLGIALTAGRRSHGILKDRHITCFPELAVTVEEINQFEF